MIQLRAVHSFESFGAVAGKRWALPNSVALSFASRRPGVGGKDAESARPDIALTVLLGTRRLAVDLWDAGFVGGEFWESLLWLVLVEGDFVHFGGIDVPA